MAITKLTRHDTCPVYVQLERWKVSGHYASLHCATHNTWIQWLHKWDVEKLQQLGVEIKPWSPINMLSLEQGGFV